MSDSPKCPKCGIVMVERFDYKVGPHGTLAIPNGKFHCMRCGMEGKTDAQSQGARGGEFGEKEHQF